MPSRSVDRGDDRDINSELPPAFVETICNNADNAEIDPEVPISPCHSGDLALEMEPGVENRETMVTAGGLAIIAGDLEDRFKQESIRIRLPACNGAHLAKLHLKALQRHPDVPVSGCRLETTSMLPVLSNLWDESDKPIVRLPAVPARNQPSYLQREKSQNTPTTKNHPVLYRESAPIAELATMQHTWKKSEYKPGRIRNPEADRHNVAALAEPTHGCEVTVELALPFARTSSEWDPGWKEWEPTRHGRASAGGILKDQGNGEKPGVGKEEELGVELGEAGRLQGTNEGRGCMPGDEMGGVKIGVGEKVKEPKAEQGRREIAGSEGKSVLEGRGARMVCAETGPIFDFRDGYPPAILQRHDNAKQQSPSRKWDPGLGTARLSSRNDDTAGKEIVLGCHLRCQPEVAGEKTSFEDKNANIIPLFAWPPPNRASLGRYQASEELVERLNIQLQRQYSYSGNPSEEGKSPGKRAQYTMPIRGEQPCQTAAASGDNQGRRTADAKQGGKIAVKDSRTCNPAIVATRRVIYRDARSGSGSDIGRNERKPLNQWPMVKQWLHTVRAFSWMEKVELQRESGATGGMEWLGRRLWDPGGRHERREACGVASIREMGRSVGVSNGLCISL